MRLRPAAAALATSAAVLALAVTTLEAAPASSAALDKPVKVVTVKDKRIKESSGLVASLANPKVVWTVNDSGDSARVFAVSLRTGRTLGVLTERHTKATDDEAMTVGRDNQGRARMWVGDIGDNSARRSSVVIRFLMQPRTSSSRTVTPVSLRVRYPGGPHDAETLIWTHSHRLLIVLKGVGGGDVLQVPSSAVRRALAGHTVSKPALAKKVGHVSQVLPDDGVALPDGRLVIRDYQGMTVYRHPKYDGSELVVQTRVQLPSQPQGETMALTDAGNSVLVGSEGVHQPLWRVGLPG